MSRATAAAYKLAAQRVFCRFIQPRAMQMHKFCKTNEKDVRQMLALAGGIGGFVYGTQRWAKQPEEVFLAGVFGAVGGALGGWAPEIVVMVWPFYKLVTKLVTKRMATLEKQLQDERKADQKEHEARQERFELERIKKEHAKLMAARRDVIQQSRLQNEGQATEDVCKDKI